MRPFPAGQPNADVELSLHYILAHRHDEPVAAGYTPVLSRSNFTITNDPVKSPVLDTYSAKDCRRNDREGWDKKSPSRTGFLVRPKQSSFASLMARHGSSLMRMAYLSSLR